MATSDGDARWVYCLVDGEEPRLDDVPAGIPGAERPRLLALDEGRWLVVATAPLSRYGEQAIERGLKDLDWVSEVALAHEAVNEALLPRARALLPMKLFTLFTSDESAREHVRQRAGEVEAVVRQIAGCVELGVRAQARPIPAPRADEPRPASGAEFLRRKKERRDAVHTAAARGRVAADDAFTRLATLARAHRKKAVPAEATRTFLDGVLLVPASEQARVEREVQALDEELRESGVELTLTGPWPPYHFLSPDLGAGEKPGAETP